MHEPPSPFFFVPVMRRAWKTIEVSTADNNGIVVITLNRPEKKNAWNDTMYDECAQVLEESAEDPAVLSVVLFGGESDYFSSGADLEEAMSWVDEIASGDFSTRNFAVFRFMKALLLCPKLVVAAVQGHAIGIGVTLLTHCDLVFVRGSSTYFSVPFFRLSLVPEYCSSVLFREMMGQARANDILLTGRRILAEEAQTLGFTSRILNSASPSVFLEDVLSILRPMLTLPNASKSLQVFKRLIRGSRREELWRQMLAELDVLDARFREGEPLDAVVSMMSERKRSKL